MADTYKPGDKVPASDIYKALHDKAHTENHEVTCVYNKIFPPCHDPIQFAKDINEQRRHETFEERAIIAAKLATLKHGSNRFEKVDGSLDPSTKTLISNERAAEQL